MTEQKGKRGMESLTGLQPGLQRTTHPPPRQEMGNTTKMFGFLQTHLKSDPRI